MKDNELKNHNFKCPKCGSSRYPVLSNTQVHGQKLRLCPVMGCPFGWPADEDHLYMTKVSILPPKPTEQWLHAHGMQIKEAAPRIPLKGDTCATWGLSDQQSGDYTEAWTCDMDNGTKFQNDKYGGLRWIVKATPEATPTDECDSSSRRIVTKTKEILTNLVDVLGEAGY